MSDKDLKHKEKYVDKSKQQILDSGFVENQNKGHNIQKAALGPNTKRK